MLQAAVSFPRRGLCVLRGFRRKFGQLLHAFLIVIESLLHEIGLHIDEAFRKLEVFIETIAPKFQPYFVDGQGVVGGRICDPRRVFSGRPLVRVPAFGNVTPISSAPLASRFVCIRRPPLVWSEWNEIQPARFQALVLKKQIRKQYSVKMTRGEV
jgi:hypothetical protein